MAELNENAEKVTGEDPWLARFRPEISRFWGYAVLVGCLVVFTPDGVLAHSPDFSFDSLIENESSRPVARYAGNVAASKDGRSGTDHGYMRGRYVIPALIFVVGLGILLFIVFVSKPVTTEKGGDTDFANEGNRGPP